MINTHTKKKCWTKPNFLMFFFMSMHQKSVSYSTSSWNSIFVYAWKFPNISHFFERISENSYAKLLRVAVTTDNSSVFNEPLSNIWAHPAIFQFGRRKKDLCDKCKQKKLICCLWTLRFRSFLEWTDMWRW